MGDPWWCLWDACGILGRSWGVPGQIRSVHGVSLNPLVACGTFLWGCRGALGGFLVAAPLIDVHYVVMREAAFGS